MGANNNRIAAILAIDSNYGLGYENNILFKDPIDMKHFRKITLEYINCVVGRKTAQSVNMNLPKRHLHVLSRKEIYYESEEMTTNVSKESLMVSNIEFIVIGGNTIYELFKDEIDIWYVTYFKKAADKVDVYLSPSVREVIEDVNNTKEVIVEDDNLLILKITKN